VVRTRNTNVKSTPNGSIIGSLSNGTYVTVLDYTMDKSWIFVGKYDEDNEEDRSPIGWVDGDFLHCRIAFYDDENEDDPNNR
jgi:Bacterial SH3 domain